MSKDPDSCSSMLCGGPPNPHCRECSHGQWNGEGKDKNGKVWTWEFNPMFGPMFVKKDGEPMARQPMEKHPAWGPFEAWLQSWLNSEPKEGT